MTNKEAAILNTHHVLKVIAVITMTMDHIGAYLYPDDLWWRVVGRLAFPIFLFLVGHALHYRTQRDTYLWALVLVVINPFLGNALFGLNILVTILCCQLLLAQVEKRDWFRRYPANILVACVIFWLPSNLLIEYGAISFLYALMGYAVRTGTIGTRTGYAVTILAQGLFIFSTCLLFEFTMAQMLASIAGISAVTMVLLHFTHRPVMLPQIPERVQRGMRFLSRHSLQYYVVHRVILQAIGTATGVLNPAFRWFS